MVKKVIITVLGAFIVATLVLVVVINMQPDDLTVTRSAVFVTTPDRVFEQVNNFHNWEGWSPWAKLDPGMKTTHSGSPWGKGAVYEWTGNDEVGEGKMTILESHPNDHIKIDLEFIKPFASTSLTEFTFTPDGDKTNVTWKMSGKNNFVTKAFCLVMDMDKMIGSDFERGLAQLKPLVEQNP